MSSNGHEKLKEMSKLKWIGIESLLISIVKKYLNKKMKITIAYDSNTLEILISDCCLTVQLAVYDLQQSKQASQYLAI